MTCIVYVLVVIVTAEMVRLSTENDYLKQEREKLDETGNKMSQKAASLVRSTCTSVDTLWMCGEEGVEE